MKALRKQYASVASITQALRMGLRSKGGASMAQSRYGPRFVDTRRSKHNPGTSSIARAGASRQHTVNIRRGPLPPRSPHPASIKQAFREALSTRQARIVRRVGLAQASWKHWGSVGRARGASLTRAPCKQYPSINSTAQALRAHHAHITQALRMHCATIVLALRNRDADITPAWRKHCAGSCAPRMHDPGSTEALRRPWCKAPVSISARGGRPQALRKHHVSISLALRKH